MNPAEVNRLLVQEYGRPQWRSHGDPLSVLIGTVLSQNTSDLNSGRAYGALMDAFDGWGAVACADPDAIERAIRVGGLSRVKALRIKAILQLVSDKVGSLDLAFLGELPLAEARSWLQVLPGVGPKTASCVLLFSLGMPALPVDTHVYRVGRRLGLVADGVSVEKAHGVLEGLVSPAGVYEFHVNMVQHGRRVCTSRRPGCPACVLRAGCAYISQSPWA